MSQRRRSEFQPVNYSPPIHVELCHTSPNQSVLEIVSDSEIVDDEQSNDYLISITYENLLAKDSICTINTNNYSYDSTLNTSEHCIRTA